MSWTPPEKDTSIIWAGTDPVNVTRERAGGKGLNLLALHNLANETGLFNVPSFFIQPLYPIKQQTYDNKDGFIFDFSKEGTESALEKIRKPFMVRSSSSLEDGVNASFAGMFLTKSNQQTYRDLQKAANEIFRSAESEEVFEYADAMSIDGTGSMSLIVQDQITDFWNKGTIQLQPDKVVMKELNSEFEIDYELIDELNRAGLFRDYSVREAYGREIDAYYAIHCAREAAKKMNLDGLVQVEYLMRKGNKPDFVQIRKLPPPKPGDNVNLKVPENIPYLEAEVCNDVSGEFILPAYVTFSEAGFKAFVTEAGVRAMLGTGDDVDERFALFFEISKLAKNRDFKIFYTGFKQRSFGLIDVNDFTDGLNKTWEQGNSLFNEYVLICDKLDASCVGMHRNTKSKKAIITCSERDRTSHAMTVARELGYVCMGSYLNMSDFSNFFHQVETGDLIHIKSDGKHAVAYIEKRRESNPYTNKL